MVLRTFVSLLVLVFVSQSSIAQNKRALDHDSYEIWNRITEKAISNNGQWVLYAMSPENMDGRLIITNPSDHREFDIPFGEQASFTYGSEAAVFKMVPPRDSVRQAKLAKKKKDEMPRDSLGIINLINGEYFSVADVISYKLPSDDGRWVAYVTNSDDSSEEPDSTGGEKESQDDKQDDDKEKESGHNLTIRSIASGASITLGNVTEYLFSEDGARLAAATSSKDGLVDGVLLVNTATSNIDTVASGEGVYKNLAFDQTGTQLAFVTNTTTYPEDQPSFVVHYYSASDGRSIPVAGDSNSPVRAGWWVSEHAGLNFSDDGTRLFFGTAPRPEPEPDDEDILDEEKVVVDVWSWTDDDFYPAQKVRLESEKKRSYLAVYHVQKDRIVQLADEDVPSIELLNEGDGRYGIANTNQPYRKERSWDYPAYYDSYLVDLENGSRREIISGIQAQASLSPAGKFITWWDHSESAWMVKATSDDRPPVNLTTALPHTVANEVHDLAYPANSYGTAGWTQDDKRFIVYDKFDIWSLDPTGRREPESLTNGQGRASNLRLRYIRLDPDEKAINTNKTALLSAFDYSSKGSGFYSLDLNSHSSLRQLTMDEVRYSTPVKSTLSETLLFTRESYLEFPDIWTADLSMGNAHKVSDANPQQSEYLWGSVDLVKWTTLDGIPVEGLLYKPEGFSPDEKYPMMVYFYEKNANSLHSHMAPAPHRSVINRTFYASRGYLVFVPDIPYKIGYPGESAMNSVMPGVTGLIAQGFVDAENIGVQGHSWGGYQIAYMVAHTNLFKAAEAGAPVANMVSAYGGVRWGTGLSRMFQYERTQSRIGGSLWEYPQRYISNSPIFVADKIETPLLIMHNDNDGAVPWYQGIELFAALRRLNKPVWLVNYNGEPHWPTTYPNKKDWTIRMQQYFDYYLKGEPAPEWITNGVPALRKGSTLGLEHVVPASSN